MTLVDIGKAREIESLIEPSAVMGGGSAANTAVVARRMGASVAYLGVVAEDAAGRDFAADLAVQNVVFPVAPVREAEIPTARCIVLVTPDGQRTMHTYLGICSEFGPEDVDPAVVEASSIVYMEGYLFDKPRAQEAFVKAATLAHAAGRRVALSLSDTFCVDRHRAAFTALVEGHIDILFANEGEIAALYGAADVDEAIAQASRATSLVVVTRGAGGATVVAAGERLDVPTPPVPVLDTTGAGDAFAAGFLAALSRGKSPAECAAVGNAAAGVVIGRIGARPGDDFSLRV